LLRGVIFRARAGRPTRSSGRTGSPAPRFAGRRLPIARSAQFAAFLTKLRPSWASRRIMGRNPMNTRSGRSRRWAARQAIMQKPALLTNWALLELQEAALAATWGVRSEQVAAHLVADVPGVEVPGPGVHLAGTDAGRVVDVRGEDPRLVDAARPESEGKAVVAPMVARDPPQDRDGNAKPLGGGRDAEPALAGDGAAVSERAQA